eukprot:TRINITY_DN60265_c0_g1_i1.p1 TRINITY_DN60265_c0_g1~~TRINITY_DN60265_c0_g1_i1.p1  ORF type:complete len:111 (+),score=53.21 TRINITY_DN60265_c0_g1_i1:56-388(+)
MLRSLVGSEMCIRDRGMFDDYGSQLQLLQGEWQKQRQIELEKAMDELHSYTKNSAAEEADFRRAIKAKFARMAEEHIASIKQTTWASEQEEMDEWERKHQEALTLSLIHI